jgi:sortase A
MSSGRRARRAILHFLSSVLMCSGVLLIADAVITVAWQEPVSAVVAERLQAALEDDLDSERAVAAEDRRRLSSTTTDERRLLAELAQRARRRADRGDAVGRIVLPTIDRDYVVAQGTDTETLRKGPAHYGDSPFPGQRGTVGVAGHRTTYGAPFRPIDKLDRGDEVVLEMSYGRFVYEVEHTRIVKPTALWVTRRVRHDRLILSACHPKYSAAKRIVVFAKLVRAKPI